MKEQQYLTLMCPPEHIKEMENVIKSYGYTLRNSPNPIHSAGGSIAFHTFELNVIYDAKDDKQHELLELQDKYCF